VSIEKVESYLELVTFLIKQMQAITPVKP